MLQKLKDVYNRLTKMEKIGIAVAVVVVLMLVF